MTRSIGTGARAGIVVVGTLLFAAVQPGAAAAKAPAPLTVQDVNAAQEAWCDGLLSIAKTHSEGGDYKKVATSVLTKLYDYDHGPVLFKPTLTFGGQTFRLTEEGAAAYFIGGNPAYPHDDGFALKPWVGCRYTNAGGDKGVRIEGNIAAVMGNVYLTSADGQEIMVDKLFVFRRDADGKLKIIAHDSSLPNAVPK